MTEPAATPQALLRGDILALGQADWVSMADVRGQLDRRGLPAAPAERQQLMLTTIRSLLEDGLVELGDIPGPDDSGFLVWPGGLDSVMQQLADRIVGQWADPDAWEYQTWLNLTPAGRKAAGLRPREGTRALSVWRPEPGSPSGSAPDESLPRLSAQDALRVADYLDAGAVVARTTARIPDPWSDNTAARVPLTQRTDGIWRWDDAVTYFVRHYHLSPGTQFLDYLREQDFAPRQVTAAQVSAVADAVFGNTAAPTPQHPLRLDGTQLLPRDLYCNYQGRIFRCDINASRVKLIVSPGQSIPPGFEPKDSSRSFVQSIAYKAIPESEVHAFYKVITTCWYKGNPYSIRRIDGPTLRLSLDGGRRENAEEPEPPAPTRDELGHFPNVEILGPGDVWATIDILEAARLTMAVVPYHLVDGLLKPVRDLTGAGYAVPTADEIFYFPSPADSPYLPPAQALAIVGDYLSVHDPSYPTTDLHPTRLRDGWQMTTTHPVETLYYVADDRHIVSAPATAPAAQVSSQLSAQFRQRHPAVDPPPAHDTGTVIFD